MYQIYLEKGALATTAIEGNTLSESEVQAHLAGTLELPESKQYLAQEIDNIVEACNDITNDLLQRPNGEIGVNEIKSFNRMALKKLPLERGVVPGEISDFSVTVGRYRGAPREDCDYLLDRLCTFLNDGFRPPAGQEIVYGILRAVIAHLYLAWIHPFGDGNGRTARLLEFKILLAAGVPSPATHLLSNHYNQTRAEYYRQLDLASRSGGDLLPMLDYAVRGLVDGLHEQIDYIRRQQWDIAWTDHIHETFRDRNSQAETRQKHLVLDLSPHRDPVPLGKIAELSPRVAKAYANRGSKTVTRDLGGLIKLGLVARNERGYRAVRETVLAFLPRRVRHGGKE